MIEKCFFCDKIIVPLNFVTMIEVEKFFKENKMEFSLNHERSRIKIGSKIICLNCERDFKKIIDFYSNDEECGCESCKTEREDEYNER